jgi:hypothetical protein
VVAAEEGPKSTKLRLMWKFVGAVENVRLI